MTHLLSLGLKAYTLPGTKGISLSTNCFFEVGPKDWTEKLGMQDLKIKNGSSTELFDLQTYLEARFWNFFIYKLSKTYVQMTKRIGRKDKTSPQAIERRT